MAERKPRVSFLDQYGVPMPPQKRSPARALSGGGNHYQGPPYDAADLYGQHTAAWSPMLWSPDGELNMYRDRIVSRVRDLVRNDGWASGAVTRILDNVIGPLIRPVPQPDYKLLAAATGIKAFDHKWSKDYSRTIDALWRSWAVDDMGHYCDAARNNTFSKLMRIAFRHKLVDGDALAVMLWMKDRVGRGRASYCTAIQVVDPDRLSNPQLQFDQQALRGGVEIDQWGAATHYHIRRAHIGDWFNAAEAMTWDRVQRETSWGRPIVVHDYDGERGATHRGGAGIFTPVMNRLKMLVKYDNAEMDAAIINAIFSAYIVSPYDRELLTDALDDNEGGELNFYQQQRSEFHNSSHLMLGNSRIPLMFPGEDIKSVAANRPSGNFAAFEGAVLKNFASGIGLSAQQVSNDWSDVNYSSARAALLEAWKTLTRRRYEFCEGFCDPIRAAWLEEVHEVDDIPLPAGAPSFPEFRGAYSRCLWMGPGRGWIDPVAEKQGAVIGMDAGLSTLLMECAEQGLEWEEVLEQRSYELERFDELGIPRPAWAGQFVAQGEPGTGGGEQPVNPTNATKVSKKPKPQ
jgi:lambda family phage portal protein